MTAPRRVLSDQISAAIGGRRVTAAVFSTFSFDPAFFELEILPLLFEGRVRGGFSHLEKVRRVQLEECLRDSVEIEVFYDRTGLVGNAGPASLDFRRVDVGRSTGVFHPKLVLILVENSESGNGEDLAPSLIVATLSANLTRSGWWENVEAGHVEVIEAESRANWRCTFRSDLLFALEQVMDSAGPEGRSRALRTVYRFVRDIAPKQGNRNASWLGRYYTRLFAGQASLFEWLKDLRIASRNWNLEVVSPYFDAHGAQALGRVIQATRPSEVRVLLPTEADGSPTVTGEQFEAVAALAKWSRFRSTITGSPRNAPSEGEAPRWVHAKVYRFWRRGEGDISLVGSVNLTGAAHSPAGAGNLEAAFLVNTASSADDSEPWLKPLDDPPARFPEEPAGKEGSSEWVGLALSVRYDWRRHALEYRLDDVHAGDVQLRSLAGEELHTIVEPVRGDWTDCGTGAADRAKKLLVSTSLAAARIATPRGSREWRILIREEGMTHKPSLITQLTPDEILQYWSLLTEPQRQAFIAEALDRDAELLGFSPDSPSRSRIHVPTVFDQFAGVFHAFERLSNWVDERLAEGHEEQVTARLFGEKYDSLPLLLRKNLTREDGDAVMAYLTFLSARQVVTRVAARWPDYWAGHGDDARGLDRLLGKLTQVRAKIPLSDPDREDMLAWYEDKFVTHAADLEAGAEEAG